MKSILASMNTNTQVTFADIFKEITSSEYIKNTVEEIQITNPIFSINDLSEVLNKVVSGIAETINEWVAKIIKDFSLITGSIKNTAVNYEDYLVTKQNYIITNEIELKNIVSRQNNRLSIINNHTRLLRLMSDLKSIMASKEYKNEKTLIKTLKKDRSLLKKLKSINEAFKILFCYYKTENGYISYAVNKHGKHYNICFNKVDGNERASIALVDYSPSDNKLNTLDSYQEILIAEVTNGSVPNLHELLFELSKRI